MFGFPLSRFLIIRIQFNDVRNQSKSEAYAGGSSTESLINHLKSKDRIHIIHESEDHKTIPEQVEIRSQIVNKEMSLFEAPKKRSNNLKYVPCLNYNQTQITETREGFFSHGTICHKTQKQTDW